MQFSCFGKDPTDDIKQSEDRMKYKKENIESGVPHIRNGDIDKDNTGPQSLQEVRSYNFHRNRLIIQSDLFRQQFAFLSI